LPGCHESFIATDLIAQQKLLRLFQLIRTLLRPPEAIYDHAGPHRHWIKKEVKSVTNVTRRDVQEFLILSSQIPIQPEVQVYPLTEGQPCAG
jgi:hypothetical protein